MRKRSLLLGMFTAVAAAATWVTPAAAVSGPDLPVPSAQTPPAPGPQPLIVGGHQATEKYDWMASLQVQGKHSCGASLIAPTWALTAAHCVKDQQPQDLSLRIGSADHTSGGTEAGVAQTVVHPDYAKKQPNGDLALIRLDHAVPNKPVKLASQAGPPGTHTRIIGWGLTCPARGCGQPPKELQQLNTTIGQPAACSLSFIDGKTEICTQQPPLTGACFGDSGGPQIEGSPGDWKLIGMTSRLGSPVPVCGTAPSVYTNATAYRDWIKQTAGV